MLTNDFYAAVLDDMEPRPPACPVCTGDEDAEPCSEECDTLVRRCRLEAAIRGLYQASRTAVALARVYRAEGPDMRLVRCLEAVQAYRMSIRTLRAAS